MLAGTPNDAGKYPKGTFYDIASKSIDKLVEIVKPKKKSESAKVNKKDEKDS